MGIYASSGIDNKIEIWSKERAEQPFMSPEEFGAALEEIMNDENKQDGERWTDISCTCAAERKRWRMNIRPDGTYVDVTFGGAGHSREILSRLGEGGRTFRIWPRWRRRIRNIVDDPHFIFVRSNFRYLHNFLRYHDIEQVDAILADLGVSSHHFDDSERGFSFRFDGDLDMRMNKRAGLTAADIVNTYEEERLANIFYLYGELKNSRKLASMIVKARNGQAIRTIGEFLEVIKPLFGREREKKELAKVFQALRIEVNQEMEALKEMLLAATEALKPGGRLVVITYHSLETAWWKHYENRKCRRESRKRFLRESEYPLPPCQQQSDCSRRNGNRKESAFKKC